MVTGVDGAEMAQTLNNLAASGISGRFKAWWNGDEVEAAAAKGNARAGKVEKVEVEELPSPSGIAEWTPQRIAAIQRLFGEGFDGPASQERARDLVNPIGLNEQMTVLDASARLGSAARTIAKETGADAAGLAYEAIEQARAENVDVLLIDTAGRLQNKTDLMAELEKVIRVIKKLDPDAPHDCLLVLDATVGQNAHSQVEVFRDMVNVTGLVMTKLDGSAKGGVVVALAEAFGLPMHAVGVGEAIEDLRPFEAQAFARNLMGLEA